LNICSLSTLKLPLRQQLNSSVQYSWDDSFPSELRNLKFLFSSFFWTQKCGFCENRWEKNRNNEFVTLFDEEDIVKMMKQGIEDDKQNRKRLKKHLQFLPESS
jgi:hypothetical protein